MAAVGSVVGAVLVALFGLTLAAGAVQPADMLLPGDLALAAPVIREDFPSKTLPPTGGYDGQQYYAIAAVLPDLDAASQYLDSPRYRLERILAPAVASLAPRGTATLLALLGLNILGAALACGALAELCAASGLWPGLGALALIPLTVALFTTTIDPLAVGLAFVGLALVERRSWRAAAVCFALAALTREAVAVYVVAVALVVAIQHRSWRAGTVLVASVTPLALWHAYLAQRIGGTFQSKTGLLAVASAPWTDIAVTAGCVTLCLIGACAWRARPAIAAVAVVSAAQVPFLAADILDWAALPRVTALGVALGVVALYNAIRARRSPFASLLVGSLTRAPEPAQT